MAKIHFRIRSTPLDLELKRPFTISRGTRDSVRNLLIIVEADGVTGIGEAAPNHRYNETRESAEAFLAGFKSFTSEEPADTAALVTAMEQHGSGEYAAKAGLEMALYDWIGKKRSMPLYQLLGAPGPFGPRTTYTIGIDDTDTIREKVLEADPYPLLKVKLGSPHDKEIIAVIRECTQKPILVDANESWQTVDQALDMIRFLENKNVFIIEQPMPAGCMDGMKVLRDKSPIPLFADESVVRNESIPELAEGFHGINIKLMKTGAIRTSLTMLQNAHEAGLKVMVGCMLGSVIADSASALVAMWADYADIDGHLLIRNNPYRGVEVLPDGRLKLPETPGLGLISDG